MTRRDFLNKAAVVSAATWTAPAVISVPLSQLNPGSNPPDSSTEVKDGGGTQNPPTTVLGSRIEAGSDLLGYSATLPATGPVVDIPTAAAAAAGLLTTGAALSNMGTRRMRRAGIDKKAQTET